MHNSDICAQVIFISEQPVPNVIWDVIKLVIVLTKAAPAFFLKCLFFSPFFWLFNRFGYLNQSGKFHIKIETFHYTQCIH